MKERRIFTQEEIDYILKNGKVKSPKEISIEIGSTYTTVAAILRRNNIKPICFKRKWNNEEILLFKKLYPITPQEEIIKIFGRNKGAILCFASKLRIKKIIRKGGLRIFLEDEAKRILELSKKFSVPELEKEFNRKQGSIIELLKRNGITPIPSSRWWTKDEELFLMKNYNILSPNEICSFLKRKWKAIVKKARELGMCRNKLDGFPRSKPKHLSKKEKKFILNNFESMTSGEMASFLNRAGGLIILFCKKNNLLSKSSRRNPSKYSDKMLLDAIIKKEKELGRTPSIEDIQKDRTLPSIDTYFDRFGTFTNACKTVGLLSGSGCFGKSCYSKNGDFCRSIKEQNITNFLIDNSILYEKDKSYSDIIPSLNSKLTMDWYINNFLVTEYFGLNNDKYNEKTKMKIKLCKENKIRIISLFEKDINNLFEIFSEFIR